MNEDGTAIIYRSFIGTIFYLKEEKLMDELLKIKEEALSKITVCTSLKDLNDLRVFYLGKKGPMQAAMRSMKDMSKEERASFGQVSNKVKQEMTQAIEDKKVALEEAEMNEKLKNETRVGMDDEALIQYKNVEIHQQELCVLSDVNLELHKGEFVYLIGKVGSGKTSLLKTLYGELDIIDGEAEVLGYDMRSIKRKHIPQLRRKLGIVFQDFQLLTDRTVYNNLEFVLRATGWKNKQEIQDRIEEVLQLVGMSNKGYKLPNELSGGEQQRIVIARAVLNSPAIILADEPTGNLDVETGKSIVELLHNICGSGSSVMMTTHNLQLLKEYPGRVYRCADHQIVDVTAEYMPRQRTIEIDLNIDN